MSAPAPSEAPAAPVADATAPASDVPAAAPAGEASAVAPTEATVGGLDAGSDAAQITLRALVSTKEAGVIIGKAGKNVADLRDQTGCKAGVSKVVPGVHDRVLSVTGTVEGVAKAYELVAQTILDNPLNPSPPSSPLTNPLAPTATPTATAIRLLISHNLMGTVIGRQGLKIKQIQDASGVRMVASKEMLPQSTERIVEVQGTPSAISAAIDEIARCLLDDWERGSGTILYTPGQAGDPGVLTASGSASRRASTASAYGGSAYGGAGAGGFGGRRASGTSDFAAAAGRNGSFSMGSLGSALPPVPTAGTSPTEASNLRTQNISIPSDMVGPIIGRGGSRITEIRRLSGSKITIAKVPHDDTGERLFSIVGTPEANEKALFLLYSQLENEKERRIRGEEEQV